MVDEGMLKKLIHEAEQAGASLAVAPMAYNAKTQEYERVDYSCLQRMREAMRQIDHDMRHPLASEIKGKRRIIVIQEPFEDWNTTLKECIP